MPYMKFDSLIQNCSPSKEHFEKNLLNDKLYNDKTSNINDQFEDQDQSD